MDRAEGLADGDAPGISIGHTRHSCSEHGIPTEYALIVCQAVPCLSVCGGPDGGHQPLGGILTTDCHVAGAPEK